MQFAVLNNIVQECSGVGFVKQGSQEKSGIG
jgi:hypothetical protein